jgi:hypothetical protein
LWSDDVPQLLKTIRLARDRLNPMTTSFGAVLTMYDPRTILSAEVVRLQNARA